MPSLQKLSAVLPRGQNSNGSYNANLSAGAIIVIVLVSAGFLVLVGYATTRFFVTSRDQSVEVQTGSEFSQAQYMREVRLRNQEQIESLAGGRKHYHHAHAQGSRYDIGGGYASGGYDSGVTSPGYSGGRTPAYSPGAHGGPGEPPQKGGVWVGERRVPDNYADPAARDSNASSMY